MTTRTLINTGLLIIVLGLVALIGFIPTKDAAPEKPPLLRLPTNQITLIEIHRAKAPLIRLEKQAGQWHMVLPKSAPVNTRAMQELLAALHAKVQASYALTELDPAALGLEKPTLRITINATTQLRFGDLTPVHYQRYVLIGDTVKLINGRAYYPLAVSAEKLSIATPANQSKKVNPLNNTP